MKQQYYLALLSSLFLVGCIGGEEQSEEESVMGAGAEGDAYLSYSYPADGQSGISPTSEVVLRFSDAIADTDTEISSKVRLETDSGEEVDFSVDKEDGGRSLVLIPDSELDPQASYSVTFEGGPLFTAEGAQIETPNAEGDEGIQFETRNLFDGPNDLVEGDDSFEVASAVPLPDDERTEPGDFGPLNFSTFRMKTTHPVHPQWKEKGGRIELKDSDGETVNANVIVRGHSISVDPCVTENLSECGSKEDVLESGETYTLSLQDVPSKTDASETLSEEFEFTPKDTSPTVVAEQVTVDSGLASGESEEQARKSVLNGQVINGVTLNSVLQGKAGPSQQTGSLFAELGYAPAFESDEPLPLRIPRNSVLKSTSIDVKIGGEVPILKALPDGKFGQKETTGDIKVTMISDASGYLSSNPYTDNESAPRHVTLFMDIAMNTESEQPNASLSQDLMGVELRGIAKIEDGVLTIDAIGVVEPELLGQEFTDSTIAFNLEADVSGDKPGDADDLRPDDGDGPELVSWTPGPEDAVPETRQEMQRPGDPVILNFDEPINEDSVSDGITLTADGTEVTDLETQVDGTTVTVNPEGGLEHGVEYTLTMDNQLTDLAGNGVASESLTFSLPELGDDSDVTQRSPFPLTTYPGYPCETTGTIDLSDATHGQCADAAPDGPEGDVLPVTKMPSDRPIRVVFSQSVDTDSIRLGETFVVEKVTQGDVGGEIGNAERVEGRLEKNNQRIRFYPDEPWDEDSFYRYTMVSEEDGDCGSVICGENGQALQTDLLEDPTDNGGDPMTIYFEGAEERESVFTPLRNLPIRDVNSNYEIDCDTPGGTDCLEPFVGSPDGEGGFKPSANAAKLSVIDQEAEALGVPVDARVGCETGGDDCPKNKFIYQTYGLNTEVVGPAEDPETGKTGIKVLLYPTMLVTTNASVYLQGFGEQRTGPQILRMRYSEEDRERRDGLIEGIIVQSDEGNPIFKTEAELMLDAPNLELPIAEALEHDLYSKPFTLDLDGPITFFDDGRMQIEQITNNAPKITVNVNARIPVVDQISSYQDCVESDDGDPISCLDPDKQEEEEKGDIRIPLEIPEEGVYLNFLSNPVKDLPQELRQTKSEQ